MKCLKSKATKFAWLAVLAGCLMVISTGCHRKTTTTTNFPIVSTNAAVQRQFEWNYQTLILPYQKGQDTNRNWDKPVERAFISYARLRAGFNSSLETGIIETNCDAAIAAGCRDPMIGYLYARFSVIHQDIPQITRANSISAAARKMERSQYPGVRKYWAFVSAAGELKAAVSNDTPMELMDLRGKAVNYLVNAISDKSMPPEEVCGDCSCLFDTLHLNRTFFAGAYSIIEPLLMKNHDRSIALWVKGDAYIDMAWQARGSGYADTVTEAGWTNFEARLQVAQDALNEAWLLNSNQSAIATDMMTVELGQGKGRGRMELWFQRAMALDPNNLCACDKKRYYLEPKWYGSAEDIIAFGRECVESKEWGGCVPLALVNVHKALVDYVDDSQRALYWQKPSVWPDLQEAFTKYLQTYPDDFNERQEYALYAYRCEQWDELNKQLPKLGKIHFDVFGGKADYDKMVKLAKEHAGGIQSTSPVQKNIQRAAN
jgi:hypothetical protein